jgi:lipopolysaccharide export system protein LptA
VSSEFSGLDVSGFATNNLTSSSNKVRVTSNQFTFSQKENNVQYLGNVNVSEEGTRLRCDKLQFISAGASNGFEQVIGEGNARIDVDNPIRNLAHQETSSSMCEHKMNLLFR